MNTSRLYFGAAYYDEYMPYERMDTDMKMMQDAGMNVIRIAESTWSTWEPQEGVFDFTKLKGMLDCAYKHGISVIVGTPTYAVPTWMVKKHPDILSLTHSGQCLYGHRQNMDITHPDYLFYCERIIRKMMEVVSGYDNVIGFQIDNETKPYDTCSERAQKMFVRGLKEKYPDIEEFNREFGLDYWSNRINAWEDFPDVRGTINGSLGAEYKKFQRKLVTDFHKWQAGIIREYIKDGQFITHNFDYEWRSFSFGIQPEVNQFDSAKCMDVAGCDIYHPSENELTGAEIAFGGAVAYALKKDNYLVLETQAQGSFGWLPYKGQLRLQAYSHIASGANSVMYWHWHSIHNAIESYWKGVLSHNLKENATYREACIIGREFERIGSHIMNLKKNCDVAIMVSNDSLAGFEEFPVNDKINYNDIVRWIYDAFYRMNIECSLINSDEKELSAYKVVVVPAMYSAGAETIENLRNYVKNGGNLVMTYRSLFADEQIKIYPDDQPYGMTDVIGATYDQFTKPVDVRLKGRGFSGVDSEVLYWMELLIPGECEVWASYSHKYFQEYAAVVHNRFGKGTATYIGCHMDTESLENVIERVLETADIQKPRIQFPLIRKTGINDFGKKIHFYLNYSSNEISFFNDEIEGKDLLTGKYAGKNENITIEPWNLVMIEEGE
ncbi:MAG: beta-galactosidase [Thermoflexaceae bacterium]|nr:beta-galactosidase [Thermoflexaceae bacterium]